MPAPMEECDTRTTSTQSGKEWSLVKDTIINLYVTEDRPLPAVMLIMKEEHGFQARYGSLHC